MNLSSNRQQHRNLAEKIQFSPLRIRGWGLILRLRRLAQQLIHKLPELLERLRHHGLRV